MNKLTSKNYEEAMKEEVVFVDFWASWCGPCMAFGPIYESVSKKFEGKAQFYKCNVDEERNLALKQGINSIPCVMVFKRGEVVDKSIGLLKEDAFENFVQKQF